MRAYVSDGLAKNPEITRLAETVIQVVAASAARARAADSRPADVRLPVNRNSLEHLFHNTVSSQTPALRQLRRVPLRPNNNGSAHLIGINFNSDKSVLDQAITNGIFAKVRLSPATLTGATFNQATNSWRVPQRSTEELVDAISRSIAARVVDKPARPTATPSAKGRELVLRIEKVECVKRVGPEAINDWDGKDHIFSGGVGWDSRDGDTPPRAGATVTPSLVKIPQFSVGTFANDGDVRTFNPDREICSFNLTAPGVWPRQFFATIALTELDSGKEFTDFLTQLWEMLKPAVLQLVTAAVTAAAGGGIGALVGTQMAPIIGTIIGAVLGALIGWFVSFAINSLNDDIFETAKFPNLTLIEPTGIPGSATNRSSSSQAEFVIPGKTASYIVHYYWELVF